MKITKQDLAMAVTISAGEVARYISILEHDEYMFNLMDDSVAVAPTVRLPLSGILGYDFSSGMKFKFYPSWEYFPDRSEPVNLSASVRALERCDDVITHPGDVQGRTDETGTLYEHPEM